jgi:SEC-C motif domain protein
MLLQPFCPCGSAILYSQCCEPYLLGKAFAPTAEALMRSRYTAYHKGNVDYLIATLHPKSSQKIDRQSLLETITTTRWLGLTVIKAQKGQIQDRRGIVEFEAKYEEIKGRSGAKERKKDRPGCLHERSRFVKEEGQWFYSEGDILP